MSISVPLGKGRQAAPGSRSRKRDANSSRSKPAGNAERFERHQVLCYDTYQELYATHVTKPETFAYTHAAHRAHSHSGDHRRGFPRAGRSPSFRWLKGNGRYFVDLNQRTG